MTPDPNPNPPAVVDLTPGEDVLAALPGTGLRVRVHVVDIDYDYAGAASQRGHFVTVAVSAEHVRDGAPAPFSVEAVGA